MLIRTAIAADVARLATLVRQYWEFESIGGFDQPRIEALLRGLLAAPERGGCWVADAGRELAGYLLATYMFSLEHGGLMAEIDEFFVTSAGRSVGVGSRLLETAERDITRIAMNTKIFAGVLSLCLLPISLVMAADDPPSDPSLAGDQARAVGDTVKENAKVIVDAAKQGVEQATNTAKDVAHEVVVATKEGAQEVATTARNGSEKVKAAVQKNTKPAKAPAPATPAKAPTPSTPGEPAAPQPPPAKAPA